MATTVNGDGFRRRQERKLDRAKTRAAKEDILKEVRNSRSDRAANVLSAPGSKKGPKSISTSTTDSRNSGNTSNTNSTASKSGSEAASSAGSTSRGGTGGRSNAVVSGSGNSNSTNAVKKYKYGGMKKMNNGGSSATVMNSGNSSSSNRVNINSGNKTTSSGKTGAQLKKEGMAMKAKGIELKKAGKKLKESGKNSVSEKVKDAMKLPLLGPIGYGISKLMKTGGMVNSNTKVSVLKSAGSKGVKSGVNKKASTQNSPKGRTGGTNKSVPRPTKG